jgi:hypothetical protein
LPRKKPGISTSDRDILRPRKEPAVAEDRPPPNRLIPDIGDTVESLAAFINAVARALIDGDIDEKKADSLTAMHRTALQNIKARDAKQEDRELDEMLRRAEAVEAAGLQREADDRRHVTRGAVPTPDADAERGDGDE